MVHSTTGGGGGGTRGGVIIHRQMITTFSCMDIVGFCIIALTSLCLGLYSIALLHVSLANYSNVRQTGYPPFPPF